MKKIIVLLGFLSTVLLFAQVPEGVDHGDLAAPIEIAVLGLENEQNTVPEYAYWVAKDALIRGVLSINRFILKDYSSYALKFTELEQFLSYLKSGKPAATASPLPPQTSGEPGAKPGDTALEQIQEESQQDIANEFGTDLAETIGELQTPEKPPEEQPPQAPQPPVDQPQTAGAPVTGIFAALPAPVLEQLRSVPYIIYPRLTGYTNHYREEQKIIEKEVTDDSGNQEQVKQRVREETGTASFRLIIEILDTAQGKMLENRSVTVHGEYSTTQELADEDTRQYDNEALELLGQVVDSLTADPEAEAEKERREYELRKSEHIREASLQAAAKIQGQIYNLLTKARSFHMDIRVVKIEGNTVYLNMGALWDIFAGNEFIITTSAGQEAFVRVFRSRDKYSQAVVLWGYPQENNLALRRLGGGLNFEIRAGSYVLWGSTQYKSLAETLMRGLTPGLSKQTEFWPYLSLITELELGYNMKFALETGLAFSPQGFETIILDVALGPGLRFYFGRLSLDGYLLLGMDYLAHAHGVTSAYASSTLGLAPSGSGSDTIEVIARGVGFYGKPALSINYQFGPNFQLNLKGDYRYNFFKDYLNIQATQKVGKETAMLYNRQFSNSYFDMNGFSVTAGLVFRF